MQQSVNETEKSSEFYRFQVIQGRKLGDGKVEKTKTVGMAYLKAGQDIYTLRLWTFLETRYYLLPSQREQGLYFVMTREPTKNPSAKSKYFWNIIGSARVDSRTGYMEIELDLFEKRLYMNLFPEEKAQANRIAPPPIDFASFEESIA